MDINWVALFDSPCHVDLIARWFPLHVLSLDRSVTYHFGSPDNHPCLWLTLPKSPLESPKPQLFHIQSPSWIRLSSPLNPSLPPSPSHPWWVDEASDIWACSDWQVSECTQQGVLPKSLWGRAVQCGYTVVSIHHNMYRECVCGRWGVPVCISAARVSGSNQDASAQMSRAMDYRPIEYLALWTSDKNFAWKLLVCKGYLGWTINWGRKLATKERSCGFWLEFEARGDWTVPCTSYCCTLVSVPVRSAPLCCHSHCPAHLGSTESQRKSTRDSCSLCQYSGQSLQLCVCFCCAIKLDGGCVWVWNACHNHRHQRGRNRHSGMRYRALWTNPSPGWTLTSGGIGSSGVKQQPLGYFNREGIGFFFPGTASGKWEWLLQLLPWIIQRHAATEAAGLSCFVPSIFRMARCTTGCFCNFETLVSIKWD